jgi:hypothetical protein
MFRSSWADLVGQWCVDYNQRYEKAPGPNIQSAFESWAGDTRNQDVVEIVRQFLQGLSQQYRRLRRNSNSDYVIDMAGKYFNRVQLERLSDTIQADLTTGKVNKAIQRVTGYHRVEMGTGQWIDVLGDKEAIRESLDLQEHESLIKYRDGLGEFFGNRLERDGFIAVMGPDKRGKSFWLLDMAFTALLQRRRVAFFECGDLSQNQIMRRFMIRVSRHPVRPSRVKYPTSIRPDGNGSAIIPYQRRNYREGLTWQKAYKRCRRLTEGQHINSLLRLSCHANDTLTVDHIQHLLNEWKQDDWIPDVIVIDYADILNMNYPGLEGRERIGHTWKQMRKLSQEQHCLVITATQTDSAAYDATIVSRKHFSDDKRKNAHVTGMIGLNQTPDEKEIGLMRLNWVVLREGWFSEKRCCYVATCFELANMSLRSYYYAHAKRKKQ